MNLTINTENKNPPDSFAKNCIAIIDGDIAPKAINGNSIESDIDPKILLKFDFFMYVFNENRL